MKLNDSQWSTHQNWPIRYEKTPQHPKHRKLTNPWPLPHTGRGQYQQRTTPQYHINTSTQTQYQLTALGNPHPLSDQPAPATQNLAVTLDAQVLSRDTKVIDKRLREAYLFGCPASLERFEVTPDRGITQDRIDRLATCEWINHGQDLIIVGATGTGKSYLAKALGVAACRSKLTARYYRLNECEIGVVGTGCLRSCVVGTGGVRSRYWVGFSFIVVSGGVMFLWRRG
ncbi:ATP-binding protein [Corynebacterium glucuronolyticum]